MIPVSEQFHKEAVGQVVEPKGACYISFTKRLSGNRQYFQLNSSTLNGKDLLKGATDDPIQNWDEYEYVDYSDRLVAMEWERSIEFPDSVQSALCDVVFDNHDGFFNPENATSPISEYNVVNRPLKLYAGYRNAGLVPQFVGMTEKTPTIDNKRKTATYHGIDFLYAIGQQELTDIVAMRNVRTDEVLAAIFTQFGLNSNQFQLTHGINTIPFLFFDKGTLAGEAFKQLMQAEYGFLWLDENGIIQFRSRAFSNPQSSYAFQPYSIISINPRGSESIINHVKITADIREVQEFQEVYHKKSTVDTTSGNLWVIPARSQSVISASLEDPSYQIVTPTLGHASSVSWFTAAKSDQTPVTSGVTATGELTSNSYKITFNNTKNYDVEITELVLWGEPAKVIDEIDLDVKDTDSIDKYGEQILEIRNNPFIQSLSQAQGLARYILADRAVYNSVIEMEVRGDLSLQVGDSVTLPGEYFGVYSIDAISVQLSGGLLTTRMRLHYANPIQGFTLNESKLNSEAMLI